MSTWSKLPRSSSRVLGFEGWQTAGLNALNNRGQWPYGWQAPGLNALNNRGQWPDAWQTAGLNALNNRGQWHECLVQAAAEHFGV